MKENNTINFIGNGSCFNTDFGNNSAYYIDEEQQSLLLIDCGESIFERIMKQKILDKVEDINILITHLHTDHVVVCLLCYFFVSMGKELYQQLYILKRI